MSEYAWEIRSHVPLTPFFSLEGLPTHHFSKSKHYEFFLKQAEINLKLWNDDKPLQRHYDIQELETLKRKTFGL